MLCVPLLGLDRPICSIQQCKCQTLAQVQGTFLPLHPRQSKWVFLLLPFTNISSCRTFISKVFLIPNFFNMDRFGQKFTHSAIQLEADDEITTKFAKSCLIGKIILGRQIRTELVKSITLAEWKCRKDYVVSEIKRNMFMFSFQDEDDWKDVILNAPWSLRGGLLILSPWTSGNIPEELQFSFSPFWVQVHGLPIEYLKKENGMKIGKLIGDFVYADGIGLDEKTLWKKFLRIRVVIDTRKPLVPGFWLKRRTPLRDIWIDLKYEKLDLFCYKCGRIGTSYNICKFPEGEAKFGPWLRADSGKDFRDAATTSQAAAAIVINERGERDRNARTALVTMPQAKAIVIHSSKPETHYDTQSGQVYHSTEDIPLRVLLPRLILNSTDALIMITNCAVIYSRVACAYAYDSNWKFLMVMATYLFYLVMKLIRITRRSRIFKASIGQVTTKDHSFMALMDILLLLFFLVMLKSC